MNVIFKRMTFSSNYVKAFFVVFAFCMAAAVPFYIGSRSNAQVGTTNATFYTATLTGAPIAGAMPLGSGFYMADALNNRVLQTDVQNVNLPANTMLDVVVNGAVAGQIRLSSLRNGTLRLSSGMGQTVPTVIAGSTIAVKNGTATILSGTFTAPPTPTPFPSMTPMPTPSAAFFAPLTGATIGGVMPRGFGQYAEFGTTSRRLNIFVDNVRLPVGTSLSVLIGTATVGQIVLNRYGDGYLRLDTANGNTVPVVTAGTTATIRNGTITVLAGTFQSGGPTPSPSVTPTPHPSPSPRPNRFFGGRATGAQVVPSVTTTARGLVFVALNSDETQIRVVSGFMGLSSAQTSAKIHGPAQAGATGPVIFDLGVIGGTSGRIPDRTFNVTTEQKTQLRAGLWYMQIGSTNNPNGEIRGQISSHTRPSGFNGAEADDVAVFRPSTSTWFVKNDTGYTTELLGQPGDVPVSGDYDGDGNTDYAIYRNGSWQIRRSSDGGTTSKQFGLAGDIPVRGDYDGDGIADLTVFRPSTGVWYVEKSNGTGYIILRYGMDGDIPVASDLDGDGQTDIALFRPSNGVWYWIKSSTGENGAAQFGLDGDIPIAGDFDGDGADDISVWRPSTGVWYIWRSSDANYDIRPFGMASDVPVAGNFDGDGITDIAVFRPSTGVWYIQRSSDNTFDYKFFGIGEDIPTTRH